MTEINGAASVPQVIDLRNENARPGTQGPVDAPSATLAETDGLAVTAIQPSDPEGRDGSDNTDQSAENSQELFERAAQALQAALPDTFIAENTRLNIDLDEDTGRFIYQTIDQSTGEVVQQFPPEDILEALALFRDVEGIALDNRA